MVDHAIGAEALVSGQRQAVYVPAYSHVYHQDGRPLLLTVTLSVRNTDRDHEIALTSVRYYDSRGIEVSSHLDKPLRLKPLATAEFLIGRDDTSGGSSASFIVEWAADQTATQPIIETVMIDTERQQGISFERRGEVLANPQFDNEAEPRECPKFMPHARPMPGRG